MAAELLLGVEGGATRTTGVLAERDLRVLAERVAGPTNVHAVGEARAREAAASLIAALRDDAGSRWAALAASAFCLAGLRGDADRAFWRRVVGDARVGGAVVLTHDAAAGLAAGSADLTGILVVCGTGSLVYGRRSDGREHFVGGRGAVLGDEGSGFDIGQRGCRAAIRASDGRGEATLLQRLIPERIGLGGLDELVGWVSPFAKDRVASVAPIVFEAAGEGDAVAAEIVRGAAGELAGGVEVVARTLWPGGEAGGCPRIVLSGGVLRRQEGFRRELIVLLGRAVPQAECVVPQVSGAVGALRVAASRLGAG